jgi:hypothetical protein
MSARRAEKSASRVNSGLADLAEVSLATADRAIEILGVGELSEDPRPPHLRMANAAQLATLAEARGMAMMLYGLRAIFRQGTHVREVVDRGYLAYSARADEVRREVTGG